MRASDRFRLTRVIEGAGFVGAGLIGVVALGKRFRGGVQVYCVVVAGLVALGRLKVLGRG